MTISTEALREGLKQALSDGEIREFCFDHEEFSPVYEQFTTGMSKGQMIQLLLDYCKRRKQLPLLLEKLHAKRPDTFPAPDSTPTPPPAPTTPPTDSSYQPWPSLPPLKPLEADHTPDRAIRVFLGYAPDDQSQVQELYHRLRGDGFTPWMEAEDLLPGQTVSREIPRAVRQSDAVIVCLSRGAMERSGLHQKQINLALDEAEQQPEESIFLIPLKLEDCELPDRLRHLAPVSLSEPGGYDKLVRALRAVGP